MEDSSEKEPKAIRQARASLINGDVFYKVSNRSRFSSKQKLNQRYLWVSNDLMSIKWCNGNQKKEGKAKLKKSIKVSEMVNAVVHNNEPTHFEISICSYFLIIAFGRSGKKFMFNIYVL